MKTNYYYKFKLGHIAFFVFCMVSITLFSACEKDNIIKKEPYFEIEDNPGEVKVSAIGKTQTYVVNSNTSWEVVAQSKDDWAKVDPVLYKGEGNGVFKIIISENNTLDARTMDFAFIVNGKQQPELLRVTQAEPGPEIEPVFIIADINEGKIIGRTAQDVKINVEANIEYTYGSDATWLVFDSKDGDGTNAELTFKASANDGEVERTARVIFTCPEFPDLNTIFIITQEAKPAAVLIFQEDFSWLTTGSPIFYSTEGERRMDTWSVDEKAKGWTSTPHSQSSNQFLVYARPGFVKLGKTTYSGDLISPKLSAVTGTQNLLVKFKAIPYKTKVGTQDGNILRINIIGPGTISTGEFVIDNWPIYGTDDAAICIAHWQADGTERSFTITGATAETQIRFVGDDLIPAKTNRIFLDDIIVTTIVD